MRLNLIRRWRAANPEHAAPPKARKRKRRADTAQPDFSAAVETTERERVLAIADMAGKAGETTTLDALFKLSVDAAAVELERRRQIRNQVETAANLDPTISPTLADRFVIGGASPEEVGAALLNQLADAQSPEIATHHQPGERTRAAGGTWSDVVAKGNARRAGERGGNS